MKLHRCFFFLTWLGCATAFAELPNDALGKVEVLPESYPPHWFFAHDVAFFHMLDGKTVLLDADGEDLTQQVKGMVNSSNMAAFVSSARRPEFYVAETYYTKGHRGERRDVVTVFDKTNLNVIDEIAMEPGKRASMMPSDYALQLVDDDRYLLVYNFTPATSVTVIDVEKRAVLNEIALPTCSQIYPTGKRGFSSLCSNASMLSYQLDKQGQVIGNGRLEPFFDIDEDALFERPAMVDGMAYFPSFRGNVQEIDLRGQSAKLGRQWSLLSDEDRAAGWRPGGMQLSGADAQGRIYILMHQDGKEGSHKDPGSEIWVFDTKERKRVQLIVMTTPALALELTRDEEPLLLTTNVEMGIDVYAAKSGEHLRTIASFGQETPLILYATK